MELNPQKHKRIFLYGAGAGALFFILLLVTYRLLANELDARFYQKIDAVPTRVYSAVFWFREGVKISLEELEQRMAEREYRHISNANPAALVTGQFTISEPNDDGTRMIHVRPNAFEYPPAATSLFFSAPGVAPPSAGLISIEWKKGSIGTISAEGGQSYKAFALEPILVAQLSSSGVEARRTLPLAEIPHTLLEAIVLVEDQRFLEHSGIDPRGILRSIYVNLRAGSYVQGASTITQQLIRNIYLTRRKTIFRKISEMMMAVILEFRFSKDQILEKYLNEVYFGQSGNIAIHGVSEAAKFYFDKKLSELTIAEQSLLAGLVRGPIFYSPFRHFERAKQRQEIVLNKMAASGVITAKEFERARKESLKLTKASTIQDRAPYFTDVVKANLLKTFSEEEILGAGLRVFSTLDPYYQKVAEDSVSKGVDELETTLRQRIAQKKTAEEQRLLQGMFLAVDQSTGHLLAVVGGRSYEESNYNRALLMRREVGSIFKPFVYLSALLFGENDDGTPMNAVSKLEDKPFTYAYEDKTWAPKNYEEEFAGVVTLRFALANSINTISAQLAAKVGIDKVVEVAKSLGINGKLEPLPSLSLGAVALNPMDVLRAYVTIANFGMKKEITPVLLVLDQEDKVVSQFIPQEEQALPAGEVANLANLLTAPFSEGTAKLARVLGFTYPAAGKTGTTNDFRDSWFVGFTPRLMAMAWVGFDRDDEVVVKHRKLLKLTGAVGALPIWTKFMRLTHAGIPVEDFPFPDNLLRKMKVDLITGKRATDSCMGPSVVEEVFTFRNAPLAECHF
jgi:penicillin-binding protein 1B